MTPSSGCGAAAPASGTFDIDVDSLTREYILRLPDNYDANRPYPLIFVWHPWGGSAQQAAGNGGNGYHGLAGVAGDEVILVAGEGIDFQGNGLGWANPDGRDENFMRAMLERFDSELCVDTSRVFSTGFSFGGMMSFTLACDAADVIRAVAPQAGNSAFGSCAGGDLPVALMGFHGTEDEVVDIDGGRTGRDIIRERNGCSETTTTLQGGWCDVAGDNYQPCTCVSYEGCRIGYPVVWCEFTGPHTPAPNAGQTLWDFFSQF
jgi:poly(3-hydroxybutyrate) depolymerase